MNHFKNTCLIVILLTSFFACTEIYNPNISSDTSALVVEGLITDAPGPFTIKLAMARLLSFDSTGVSQLVVRAATVKIIDNENISYKLTESTPGSYVTPLNFKTKVGNSYRLQIQTKDGSRYQSNLEKLLPPQTFDSIRSIYATKEYLNIKNEFQNVDGTEIRVDLFKSLSETDSIPFCRFSSNVTIQYWYIYRERDINGNEIMTWHWANFGWKTYNLNSITNITERNSTSSKPLILNHSIGFVPFEASSYGLDIPLPKIIYYFRLNQYTLNGDSYLFYKQANNQLSASGKIFDPISSQLYGNMKCLSDQSKIVLGLFEVSSVRESAYLIEKQSVKDRISSIKKVLSMNVPAQPQRDDFQYKVWDGQEGKPVNDPSYTPISLPVWWYHN